MHKMQEKKVFDIILIKIYCVSAILNYRFSKISTNIMYSCKQFNNFTLKISNKW